MSDYSHLKAYNGSEPYIFVSYAHLDSNRVLPMVEALQKQGFRIWFDMGIEAGTEWSNNIAKHLRECTAFLFCASKNSVASENCLDEVAYAKSHQKASLMIFLEDDVMLPEGTEMQTARFQRMFIARHKTLESAIEKISEAPIILPCRENAPAVPMPAPKAVYPQPKEKKIPWLWIGVGAAAVLIGIVLLMVLLSGGSDEKPNHKPGSSTTQPTTEPLSLKTAELMDFVFQLEGKRYQLPADLDEFTDAGWELKLAEPVDVRGLGYHSADLWLGDLSIFVEFYNPSGDVRPLEECCVSGIQVYADDGVQFLIAKEIAPGVDVDTVVNTFGTPQYRYDSDNTSNLEYGQDDNTVTFHCSLNGKGMPYINMSRRDIAPEKSETNTDRPEYLDGYVEPEDLGDELGSGNFRLEGDIFSLPVPLEKLLEKGWCITEGAGAVVAYGEARLELTLGDVTVEVTVYNASERQTIPENCVVTEVSAYASGGVSLKLPNGLTINSTAAEAEAGMKPYVQEDDIHDYGDEVYYYARFDNDFTVQIFVDKEEDAVRNITIYYNP